MENTNIVMYTVKDLVGIFKFSLTQAYGLVKASGFPSVRIGGKYMVEKTALENWLDKNRGKKIALG